MDYLIVGLGNIGQEYANTRHNMGFMVLDAWVKASNAVFRTERYGAVAEIPFRGRKLILLKPSTYMNLSGNAVSYWLARLKLPLERLIVVCDDLNLPFGAIRMRKRGSDGGHNGLKHINALIGTEYCRIRIGIGNGFRRGEQIDFVTGAPEPEEMARIPGICEKVIGGLRSFVLVGPDRTMNFLNAKTGENGEISGNGGPGPDIIA